RFVDGHKRNFCLFQESKVIFFGQRLRSDNPWDKIVLKKVEVVGTNANVWWTWGDKNFSKGFSYKVRLQKKWILEN
ncbi:hypothetical protein, partial [Flectobacillus sp. BAB-3569]|uniref:hypothetical protein n=1 Tax=Flectobacillus sp. BAB-3569 TaxID=1509483 RepID=UPI000BC55D10